MFPECGLALVIVPSREYHYRAPHGPEAPKTKTGLAAVGSRPHFLIKTVFDPCTHPKEPFR